MANLNINQILIKRGNTLTIGSYTGPAGELVLNTETHQLVAQDGVTPGGHLVTGDVLPIQANLNTLQTEVANIAGITGNVTQLEQFFANVNLEEINSAISTLQAGGYGNANVAVYLPHNSTIAAINANIAAANAAIITANTSLKGYTDYQISTAINNLINSAPGTLDTLGEIAANLAAEGSAIGAITNSITSINANVTAANSAIVTANTAMKGYVDSVTTAWTANAAIQQTSINIINANITAANLAIAGLQSNAAVQESEISGLRANIIAANILIAAASGTYSNANVASYLVANPQPGTYSNTNVSAYIAGNLSTINSNVTAANLAISTLQANVGSFYTWANTNFGTSSYANSNVAGYLAGNITVGNLITTTANATTFKGTNFVYANGVSILTGIGGTYSNSNVTAYLSAGTDATILGLVANTTAANLVIAGHTTSINTINSNIGAFEIFSNANTAGLYNSITGANTAIQNLNANIGAYETWANANVVGLYNSIVATNANVTAANSVIAGHTTSINTINANIGSYENTTNANIGSIYNTVTTHTTWLGNLQANVYSNNNVSAYLTANPQAGTYSNTNVTAYLTTATITTTGNITASNLTTAGTYTVGSITTTGSYGNITGANVISANTLQVSNGIFWANGTAWSSTSSGTTYSNANVTAYLAAGTDATILGLVANTTATNSAISTLQANVGSFYTYANATYTGGGSSTYSNANVVAMLAANTAVFIGSVGNVTATPLQANITQVFVGNATTITQGGGSALGTTYIYNNLYFGANGSSYYRNTQSTGAAAVAMSGTGGFLFTGTSGSVTANAVNGSGLWATINGSGISTSNSLGITSAGALTAAAGLVLNTSATITTNQTTATIFNGTATTINMGGAATTINLGSATVGGAGSNVFVGNAIGTSSGNLTVRAFGTFNNLTTYAGAGGYNSPPYTNQSLTGGSGTGMTASYGATGGYPNSYVVTNPGFGYKNGDVLTLPGGLGSTVILSNYNSNYTGQGLANYNFGMDGNLILPGNMFHPSNSAIYGDFTNSTVNYRTVFRPTAANSNPGIYAAPTGTGTAASWQAANNSSLTNASKILIATNGTTDVQLVSGINGTGTYLPLSFLTSGTTQMQLDVGGNLLMVAGGNINTTGNIYGGNVIGNQYGNSIGTTATYTGNVTANYFVGNGAALTGISTVGNIYGTQPNVTLVSGSYSYVFDNTGNLTIPANGDLVMNTGGTIGTVVGTNANITINPDGSGWLVATSITPAWFGNTVTIVGNLTAGNITGTQYGNSVGTTATYSGNVTAGNVITAGASGPKTRFLWDTWQANSTSALSAFTPSGTIGGNATWDSTQAYGLKLTTTSTSQSGYINWNSSTVNYNYDMVITASIGASGGTGADGQWIYFGSNAAITGNPGNTNTYGGIAVMNHYYSSASQFEVYVGGTQTNIPYIGNGNYVTSGVTLWNASYTSFYNLTLKIRKIQNGNRMLEVYINEIYQGSVNIGSWTPAGNYFGVAAYTGGSTAQNWVRQLRIDW